MKSVGLPVCGSSHAPRGVGGRLHGHQGRPGLHLYNQGGRVPRCAAVGSDYSKNEGLSEDMKRYIQETQKNMFEINRSRLKAIEDAIRERRNSDKKDTKIEELMSKIESLEMENAKMRTQLSNGTSQQETGRNAPAPSAPSAPAAPSAPTAPAAAPIAQSPPTAPSAPSAAVPAAAQIKAKPGAAPAGDSKIVIHYASGWNDAYIHFNADKGGWTTSPGKRMERSPQGKCLVVEASEIEFVLNNGQGEWDKPNPYSNKPGNYWIDAPGEYLLKNGRLQRL